MPVTAIIELNDADDFAEAARLPNAEERGAASKHVLLESVVSLHQMRSGFLKVEQQDGSSDRVGTRDNVEIITVY